MLSRRRPSAHSTDRKSIVEGAVRAAIRVVGPFMYARKGIDWNSRRRRKTEPEALGRPDRREQCRGDHRRAARWARMEGGVEEGMRHSRWTCAKAPIMIVGELPLALSTSRMRVCRPHCPASSQLGTHGLVVEMSIQKSEKSIGFF